MEVEGSQNGKSKNPLDEEILTDLWTRMIDTMGGRPVDVYTTQLANIALFLAIVAIILPILTPHLPSIWEFMRRIISPLFGNL